MSRILAIDFGLKRIGIAVTDTLQLIATALTTVESKDIINFLKDYLSKEQVECIVIGKSVDLQNENNPIEINIQSFIVDLKKFFPETKIDRFDERYTSKMAQQTILDSGIKKMERRNKALIDKISAVIILQSYLEQIKK
ncbi:MAG TPA: Holliday junction resolvase RuvX [Bacteroidia bacterium]|nr:Holliday junction resolvase RuvX [Bacteroidia bacterium]